jgi:hypothetical protein
MNVLASVPGGAATPAEMRGVGACSSGAGRLDVFVVGADGRLYYSAQIDGRWSTWQDLGQPGPGLASRPVAVSWGPGRIDVFVRGADD